jgi:Rieske 2Fe-2S family protein
LKEQAIKDMANRHQSGYALQQDFYLDPDIYARDIERIFMQSWLYAGHISEIRDVGDYLLFDFANESVIVIRSAADEISALINVCRHRGSRICIAAAGNASRLTCQYHGWTYNLQGELIGAAQMPDTFDKSRNGLAKIHLRCLEGMVFINFADHPAKFEPLAEDLIDCLRPYRLDRAKVAHRQTYPIASNWKLAVENYCECYHCAPAHPEYSRGHGLAIPEEQYAGELEKVMRRAAACGLSSKEVNRLYLQGSEFGSDRSYERYPLMRGHVTGSQDGGPVAPLLGDIADYDGGATDFQIGPITYALASIAPTAILRGWSMSLPRTAMTMSYRNLFGYGTSRRSQINILSSVIRKAFAHAITSRDRTRKWKT